MQKILNLPAKMRQSGWYKRIQSAPLVQTVHRMGTFAGRNAFLVCWCLVLLYRLALDVIYVQGIAPLFGYMGFTSNLMLVPYLISWAAMLAFAPFVAAMNGKKTPSDLLLCCINYIYFIPMTSYFGCKGAVSAAFFAIGLVFWVVLLAYQRWIPRVALKPLAQWHSQRWMTISTVAACLFVMYVSGRYTGFRLTFNFLDVYGIRTEAAGYAMSGIESYLLGLMPILLALMLLYWLGEKRYLVALGICVVYLFLFSISAHKSTFFFLLIALACHFLYRPWMYRWLPGWLTAGVAAAILERKIIGSFHLLSLFFRRVMYVPVSLSELYFRYFQENPLNLYREGIMGKFSFNPIYSTSIVRVIGEFGGNPQTNANNGLLGDLFANLPVVLGLLLLPLILVICLRLLDAAARHVPEKLAIPLCVYFAVSLSNSVWSTVMLTHGFLAACVLLYLFPGKEAHRL